MKQYGCTKLYACLLLFLLAGCTSNEQIDGIVINTYVDLVVETADGIDLLDPNVENSLNTGSIKLFYINGDEINEVYNPSMDFVRNFKIIEDGDLRFLRLFVNDSIVNGYTSMYLDWGNGQVDSLRSVVTKTSRATICDSVWYNGTLEYPSDNQFEPRRVFKVVK